MSTVRARTDRSSSRLRVFREEELSVDDEAPVDETDAPPQARVRQAKVTEPLPLPRPPRR